jgi:predicted HicB family RNase H-like nuclease
MKRSISHALAKRLHVNVNDRLSGAITLAATKRLISVSSWCRQALLRALAEEEEYRPKKRE